MRTCARGTGTSPASPLPLTLPLPLTCVGAGGQEQGGGDVGAELGQGAGLVRALQGAGGGGGPVPDPRGGIGRQVRRKPGHPVRVRAEFDPPVLDAFGVAFFDAVRVVAFAPRAHFRAEPVRDEVPGRAAPGRVGRVGVQEVRLQRRRPGRVQVDGFIHHGPGVRPGDRPGLQSLQGQRQTVRQGQAVTQKRPGGPRSHRQDTGDLSSHRHLLALCVLQGDRRCGQGVGGPHIGRGHQHLQRSKPRLPPGHAGQAVQALIRQNPQRIIPQRASPGRTSPISNGRTSLFRTGQIGAVRSSAVGAAPGDGIQRRRQRRNSRQGLPALRTPVRAFHKPIKSSSTDKKTTGRRDDGTGACEGVFRQLTRARAAELLHQHGLAFSRQTGLRLRDRAGASRNSPAPRGPPRPW